MPTLDELDDDKFEVAQESRRVRINTLEKSGYQLWDMTPEGHERFMALKHGQEIIKTVKYDPATASYRIE